MNAIELCILGKKIQGAGIIAGSSISNSSKIHREQITVGYYIKICHDLTWQ